MVVRQLANAGFVAEHETSREGQRPERTVYAITDTGRAELRDWGSAPRSGGPACWSSSRATPARRCR